ncbi:type II toxin-antitoxin system PemK/MazF family toxin [Patescibacteria group bacterium]|nr:type II toxin-antitoxin system PemK/MazF family toxin [Patescibacteria group bacterium]MBU1682354.1 type II toxin-antitoxin system PemK/MazF family toxin [Patescibacteria group bacterium]MBU1935411.1 type II toxin-antitoxin system PemK/MazF family toxin [Patescibacteria group bacterium]
MNNQYKKNFWDWHEIKNAIHHTSKKQVYFYEREIWFCSLGVNVGHEQDGGSKTFKRPVLVLKKFNKETFWGIPITSKNKIDKYHFQFQYKNRRYSLILSQVRLLDSKRLIKKINSLSKKEFDQIKEQFVKILQ